MPKSRKELKSQLGRDILWLCHDLFLVLLNKRDLAAYYLAHTRDSQSHENMQRKAEGVKMDDASEWKQVRKPWISQWTRLHRHGVAVFATGLFLGMSITGIVVLSIANSSSSFAG